MNISTLAISDLRDLWREHDAARSFRDRGGRCSMADHRTRIHWTWRDPTGLLRSIRVERRNGRNGRLYWREAHETVGTKVLDESALKPLETLEQLEAILERLQRFVEKPMPSQDLLPGFSDGPLRDAPTPKRGSVNIQHVPATSLRPETGPMQFGDDWPGVFVRGDNAAYYGGCLRAVLDGQAGTIRTAVVEDLLDLLVGGGL